VRCRRLASPSWIYGEQSCNWTVILRVIRSLFPISAHQRSISRMRRISKTLEANSTFYAPVGCDMRQVTYRIPTNIRRHRKKFRRYGELAPGILNLHSILIYYQRHTTCTLGCVVKQHQKAESRFQNSSYPKPKVLTLSDPMSDIVRHYDFPVPDVFPHVVRTLANR
jgi:hypothetical protein